MCQREARAKPLDLPRSLRGLFLGPAASARPRHLNGMADQVLGLSKRSSPLHVLAGWSDNWNVRVVKSDGGTKVMEAIHQLEGGRFAHVIDIGFVGES